MGVRAATGCDILLDNHPHDSYIWSRRARSAARFRVARVIQERRIDYADEEEEEEEEEGLS